MVSLHQARAVLASTPRANLRTRARPQGYRHAFRPRGASLASRPTNPPAASREPPGFRRKGFRVRTPRGARGVGVSTTQRPSSRPRITVLSLYDHELTTELTDVPTLTHANTDAERKVHPRQVQHLARLLRRVLRLGQGTHQRGARLVRRRIKVDDAPNLSPNRTIAPVLEIAWTDDDVAPFRAFAFVFAGRSPRRG